MSVPDELRRYVPRTDLYDSLELVHYHMPVEQPPATASYIIFKKGNKTYAKNGTYGHIEYEDTDAAKVINDALDSLGDNGGKILIKNGTYVITSTIKIMHDNIQLLGESWNTILKRVGQSLDGPVIGVGGVREKIVNNVVVANLQIDGNKSAGVTTPVDCKGLLFHPPIPSSPYTEDKYMHHNIAYRVYAHDCGSEGISFDFNIESKCIECRCEDNNWLDIAMYDGFRNVVAYCNTKGGKGGFNLNNLANSIIIGCISKDHTETDATGFKMGTEVAERPAKNNILANCISVNDYIPFDTGSFVDGTYSGGHIIANNIIMNASAPSYLRRAVRCLVIGNKWVNTDGHGLYIWGGSRNQIVGNTFYNIGVSSNNTYSCILVRTVSTGDTIKNIIKENYFYSDAANKPAYGVNEFDADVDYNVIAENIFEGMATDNIRQQGTNDQIYDNITLS